jgi:hypothetical protein
MHTAEECFEATLSGSGCMRGHLIIRERLLKARD